MSDSALDVRIEDGKLTIEIGVDTLIHAVSYGIGPWGLEVADSAQAAGSILAVLCREEEDGTTPVHRILDDAARDAVEHGYEGFREAGGEDE